MKPSAPVTITVCAIIEVSFYSVVAAGQQNRFLKPYCKAQRAAFFFILHSTAALYGLHSIFSFSVYSNTSIFSSFLPPLTACRALQKAALCL